MVIVTSPVQLKIWLDIISNSTSRKCMINRENKDEPVINRPYKTNLLMERPKTLGSNLLSQCNFNFI